MEVKFSKIVLLMFVVILTFAFLQTSAFASIDEYEDRLKEDYSFKVNSWNSEIVLDEDDCYHVTETLDVSFLEVKHGIYRLLPTKGVFDRNGVQTNYRAKVTDVMVTCMKSGVESDVPFNVDEDSDSVQITIGDPDSYAESNMTYIISYNYDMYGDRMKKGDEAFFNIIGTRWPTDIAKMTFSVTFPKPIDVKKFGVRNDREEIPFEYDAKMNTVTCDVGEVFYGDGVSFRAVLPEDYFEEASVTDGVVPRYMENNALLSKLYLGFNFLFVPFLALIVLIGSVLGRFRFKTKKEKIYEPVMVTPPKKSGRALSSYEMNWIYQERLCSADVISMIFDLANDGFIGIEEIDENSHRFIKEKEYTGYDKIKKKFMERFFSYGTEENGKMVVTTNVLEDRFYSDINEMLTDVKNKYPEEAMYDASSALSSKLTLKWCGCGLLILGFIMVFVGFSGFIPWTFAILGISFVVSTFIFFTGFRAGRVLKPVYKDLRGQIGGFKKFLTMAEKSRLETLVKENPNYFYDTLAYAYALDVTKEYVENFEGIAIKAPRYYYSARHRDDFVPIRFVSRLSQDLDKTRSVPSSSSPSGGRSFVGDGG